MSAPHTQGLLVVNPIQLDQIATADASKEIARVTHFGHSTDTVIANARRLAACWNAFEGLDTEQIESMVNVPDFFFKHMELQEAVLAMLDREDNDCMPAGWSLDRVREIARKLRRSSGDRAVRRQHDDAYLAHDVESTRTGRAA